MSSLSRCRVVLVRTHYAGNLGSVCRAMANFGLSELVLVDPVVNLADPMAARMAVKAAPILNSARIEHSLSDAVADCGWVLATSGETRGTARQGFWGTPEVQVLALIDTLAASPAAIVFGPEPSGLTVEEIALCTAMAFIPADAGYPSLNLALAVGVVLYELRKQFDARGLTPELVPGERPANYRQQEILFARLRAGLESVRFLWDDRADGLFHVIRQVIARGRPTVKELQVLHGLAGQLVHVARAYGVRHPRDGRPPAGLFGKSEP